MIRRLSVVSILFAVSGMCSAAAPACQFERLPVGAQKLGAWIDKSNWLALEHQRLTLQYGEVFMPAWRLQPPDKVVPPPARLRPIDDFPALDPLDGRPNKLAFLLDSRLYADGLVVLSNGRLVAERYRNGLQPEKPRLLLEATRPWLNLLGAISMSTGKLAADKAVSRYLPAFNGAAGLRKLSVQRLLENEEAHAWSAEDLRAWRQAAGWVGAQPAAVRPWLMQAGRWDKPLAERQGNDPGAGPDDELLAWLLAESNRQALSRLFCEQLMVRNRPEHPVLWLSDAEGVELAAGLAMSLRDFAKLGQELIEARGSRGRIPAWFIETLTASSGLRSGEIKGLAKGSEARYGFVHLGGTANRVALIGSYGSSLYIDFDQRLVVAIYASYPGANTPSLLATLSEVWKTLRHEIPKRAP